MEDDTYANLQDACGMTSAQQEVLQGHDRMRDAEEKAVSLGCVASGGAGDQARRVKLIQHARGVMIADM